MLYLHNLVHDLNKINYLHFSIVVYRDYGFGQLEDVVNLMRLKSLILENLQTYFNRIELITSFICDLGRNVLT